MAAKEGEEGRAEESPKDPEDPEEDLEDDLDDDPPLSGDSVEDDASEQAAPPQLV